DTAAAPGTRFADAVPVADHQIVIDVPASRPDLLCHKGVARALAAVLGGVVKLPEIPIGPSDRRTVGPTHRPTVRQPDRSVVDGVEVRLEDPEGCPRYMAAVIRGVRVGESPPWLAGRLSAVGQRPINNIVDATNYVLFELNQPLHAFDLAKLRGPAVVIRRARPQEKIVTLDGVERTLTPDMTAICDAARPTIVAGVMGSAESEVTPATTDLVLECAYFQPTRIRRTRRALELSSEPSYRFERGIDLLGMPDALPRAIELIRAAAGGAGQRARAPATRPGRVLRGPHNPPRAARWAGRRRDPEPHVGRRGTSSSPAHPGPGAPGRAQLGQPQARYPAVRGGDGVPHHAAGARGMGCRGRSAHRSPPSAPLVRGCEST